MAKRPAPLLIDTNLCVLLAVGATDPNYIARHKRLSAFDIHDYWIVKQIVASAPSLLFCPNVLTEVSNLVRLAPESIGQNVCQTLAGIVARSDERYVESLIAMSDPRYLALGLTDAVLLTLAEQGASLFTADLGLYLAALRAGHEATNYNHLREQRRDYR